jgi:hypothetical protein
MNRNLVNVILAAATILAAAACNLQRNKFISGDTTVDALAKTVLQQSAVAKTQNGVPPTLTVTVPYTPAFTPTITLTPSVTLTPTHERVTITVSKNTNCRTGPDKFFDLVGTMKVGETAEAIGRNEAKTYWVIRLPSNTAKTCWLWWEWATLTGNGDALPIIESPPTPTWSPKPDFTFYYLGLTSCPAPKIVRLQVVNTGNVAWESYRVSIKDMVTTVTTSVALNDFGDYSGCAPLATVPTIGPGGTAYAVGIVAPGMSGHAMVLTLHLYTQNSSSGTHMSGNFNFTMP